MTEQMLADLSPKEREEMLRTNATSISEGHYFRKFTEEEISERKDTLVDTCIQIDAKEIEFTEVKKTYSDAIKLQKEARTNLTKVIKQKGEDTHGELFHFADHENSYMISFDINGNEVTRRRLRPDEKQQNIFSLNQKSA